ncbi:MAG: extracellular solute-binding protein [Caldisericum sp.]|nr:extracellular solute-binding protein [Caldisericum sp.]
MKKLIAVLAIVVMLFTFVRIVPTVSAENVKTVVVYVGKTQATIDGKSTTLDQAPVVVNGRTMVPIRFVSEALGATVDWNNATREATIKLLGNTIVLKIDSPTATVNGYTVYLDAPATVVKSTGRTVVPLRFVSDSLGADVTWNATDKSVTVKFSEDWIKNPTEITFWHAMQAALGQALTKLIDEFNATHPRYKIVQTAIANYTSLQQKTTAALASGQPPVITQAYENWVANYMLGNLLTPMEKFVKDPSMGLSQADINDFFPIMWKDGYLPDGKMWMFPFNKSVDVMYYNVDMLKEAGFDHPPKTWDEFATMVKALTKPDGSQWGASLGMSSSDAIVDIWYSMVYEWGGKVLTDDYKNVLFDKDPNALAPVKFLNELYKNGYIHFTNGYDYQSDFGNKKCAFVFGSVVGYTYINQAVGGRFTWAQAPIPAGPKGQYAPLSGANVVIFGNKYNPEEVRGAWEFVKWFTSTYQTARWSIDTAYLPVRKSALELPLLKDFIQNHPERRAGFDELPNALIEPVSREWTQAYVDIGAELQKIFLQKISPEDGYKELGQKLRSYIH